MLCDLATLAYDAMDEGLTVQEVVRDRLDPVMAGDTGEEQFVKKKLYDHMIDTYRQMSSDDFGQELF